MTDRPFGLPEGAQVPEAVLQTSVPGIVIWRYRRRTVTVDGQKRRTKTYSVTHEPSGYAMLAGTRGAKHALSLAQALGAVEQLGDVRWRGKRFDWTQPIEAIIANDRAWMACLYVGGWKVVSPERIEKATREWAARNGLELDWRPKPKESTDAA